VLLLVITILLSFAATLHASGQSAPLLAGSSVCEITPSPGSPMSGYGGRNNKPALGVRDRLYARCLALEGPGGLKVAVVSADLLAFTPDLRASILAKTADLGFDLVLLAATHTHSGPGGYQKGWAVGRFLMGTYSQGMFDVLAGRIAGCIRDARTNLVPAQVAYGTGSAPELVRNRRCEAGPTDPQVGILEVETLRGDTIALVVSFGAHPTVLSPENLFYSGDYAGATERVLEAWVGAPVLFLAGALGDQKPHYPGTREWEAPLAEQFKEADRIGEALAAVVMRSLGSFASEALTSMSAREAKVDLPGTNLRDRCFWYVLTPLARMLFHTIFHPSTIFQAVRLNDLVLIGMPAEVSSEIAARLREHVPFRVVVPVSLANDSLGYVLTPEDYATGGYEACMSFYGKDFGTFFERQALATVSALW
jgi:neutral ceramidase